MLKILFLCSKYFHDSKMSRGRFQQKAAIGRMPGVELKTWGTGWPGYRDDLTVQENLDPSGYAPDLISIYKGEDHRATCDTVAPRECAWNEAWAVVEKDRCKKEIEEHKIDLAIFHHQIDRDIIGPSLPSSVSHHSIPHCAPAWMADHSRPWEERDIPVLLSGVISKEIYPVRQKFFNVIKSGRVPGAQIRQHPGYRIKNVDNQFVEYAKELGRTKIAICTASKYSYALAKYPESAMAGCCMIGDVPPEYVRRGRLGEAIVPILPDDSEDVIADRLNALIADDGRAKETATRGQRIAAVSLTMSVYAARYVSIVAEFLAKRDPIKYQAMRP